MKAKAQRGARRQPTNRPGAAMGKNKVTIEGRIERTRLVEQLESLVASLKAGTVCVRQGDESVRLCPAPIVEFEMEASQKKDKEKLSLKISWKAGEGCGAGIDASFTPEEPGSGAS
jgi:amphi-Trp domain-containing protein